jgi:hypothetical protein
LTNHPFDLAYQAAEAFTEALKKRTKKAAGFHEDFTPSAHLFQFRLRRALQKKCFAKRTWRMKIKQI